MGGLLRDGGLSDSLPRPLRWPPLSQRRDGDFESLRSPFWTKATGGLFSRLPQTLNSMPGQAKLVLVTSPAHPPLSSYLRTYLAERSTERSATTMDRTKSALSTIILGLGDPAPQDVDMPSVKAYRQGRLKLGRSPRTINKEVGCLRVFLSSLVEDEVLAVNPITKLRDLKISPQEKRIKRRALSQGETRLLLETSAAADRRHPTKVAQTPMWLTFLETGARWSELEALTWAYTDLDSGVLTFVRTKSGRSRSVPIRPALCRALAEMRSQNRQRVSQAGPLDHVFLPPRGGVRWGDNRRNALRALRALCTRAGIPIKNARGEQVDIHALRHTAATAMARADLPLGVTQAILGHSDPALTAGVYTHRQTEDLRKSLVRAGLHENTGSPHGDPALDGARYQIRTDDPSFTKARVIEASGGSFDLQAVVQALAEGIPVLLQPTP